jgi:hypothetical protein
VYHHQSQRTEDEKMTADFRSYEERIGTQFALLYPLRAGLFGVKSGSSTSLPAAPKVEDSTTANATGVRAKSRRFSQRRGSSMTELDRVQVQLPDSETDEPQELQCPVTTCYQRTSGADAVTPVLQRRVFLNSSDNIRGSIGDLMNLKQYGSVWSVRSATDSIAAAVPLTTITSRRMLEAPEEADANEMAPVDEDQVPPLPHPARPLTTIQRTERLSRLIRSNAKMVRRKNVSLSFEMVTLKFLS